jgi:hypothetical protein
MSVVSINMGQINKRKAKGIDAGESMLVGGMMIGW